MEISERNLERLESMDDGLKLQVENLNLRRAYIKLKLAEEELSQFKSGIKTASIFSVKSNLCDAYNLTSQHSALPVVGHHQSHEIRNLLERILEICRINNFKVSHKNKGFQGDVLKID